MDALILPDNSKLEGDGHVSMNPRLRLGFKSIEMGSNDVSNLILLGTTLPRVQQGKAQYNPQRKGLHQY